MQHDYRAVGWCPGASRDCACDGSLFILIQWSFQRVSEANCGAFDVALRTNRLQGEGKIGIKLR